MARVRMAGIAAVAAAVSVPGAAAFGQNFSTDFSEGSIPEFFDLLPGVVVDMVEGEAPPTGGSAYMLDGDEAFNHYFEDGRQMGTLRLRVWDNAWRNIDEETGEPDGGVNLRGNRWGAFGTDSDGNELVGGTGTEYRTFINTNQTYPAAPAFTSNTNGTSSWFSMGWPGGGMARPAEASWVDFELQYTRGSQYTYSISYEDENGDPYEFSHTRDYETDAMIGGAEGIYLLGGANENLGPLFIDHMEWEIFDPEFAIGDMNLDEVVDAADVAPFVQALTDPDGYMDEYGIDPIEVGDINNDELFDAADVAPFVELLVGGGSNSVAVPEPGSLALLSIGGLLLMRRRRAA